MPFAVLVNTGFNVHEEPIVNTPGECIMRDGRIDFAVTDRAMKSVKIAAFVSRLGVL
ncbi:MAG: hypothetical protein WCD30_13390 [Pseudolabrys sp.]